MGLLRDVRKQYYVFTRRTDIVQEPNLFVEIANGFVRDAFMLITNRSCCGWVVVIGFALVVHFAKPSDFLL